MGFSRLEYWSGLPFPFPGDLPNPGVKPGSPALQADALLFKLPILRKAPQISGWPKSSFGFIISWQNQYEHFGLPNILFECLVRARLRVGTGGWDRLTSPHSGELCFLEPCALLSVVIQLPSCVWLFATPWTAACHESFCQRHQYLMIVVLRQRDAVVHPEGCELNYEFHVL